MNEAEQVLPDDREAGSVRLRRLIDRMPLLLGLILAAVYLAAELVYFGGDLGFPLDDPWIHLQFARNLASGDGLSYNAGELVPGSTAPLWTALLSIVSVLPGSALLWTKILGAVLYLVGIELTRRLAREIGLGSALAAFAAAMVAVTGWLVWGAISGMEVPLFIALSLWGMMLHVRELRQQDRPSISLFVFGAAILARPEGLLLLALAVVDRLIVPVRDAEGGVSLRWPSVMPVLWGLLTAAVVIVPVAVFNEVTSGSALPTTFSAKSTGVVQYLPSLHVIYKTLSIFFSAHPYFTLVAPAGFLVLVERMGSGRWAGLLPGLWLFGLPVAYSTFGGVLEESLAGNFGRYYFPLFPVLAVLGALGLQRAGAALGGVMRAGALRVPIGAIVLALIAWPTVTGAYRGLGRYLQSIDNVRKSDVAIARWLEPRLPPEAVLAVNDVGAVKYMLPNRIVDMAGIIHPEIIRKMRESGRAGRDWHEGVLEFLEGHKPDYLVVFPSWYPRLATVDPAFRLEYQLEIPENITMGGSELAVYSTPWTRFPLTEPAGETGR